MRLACQPDRRHAPSPLLLPIQQGTSKIRVFAATVAQHAHATGCALLGQHHGTGIVDADHEGAAWSQPLDELVAAPQVGDPRIRLTPQIRKGRVVEALTQNPSVTHAWKVIIPPEAGEQS